MSSPGSGGGLEPGPLMQPGDNCNSCHGSPNTSYPEARAWSVAGTVFEGPDSKVGAEGVKVTIVDIAGTTEELTTNAAGNFYTVQAFETPYNVTFEKDGVSVTMPAPPPGGGCNACHNDSKIGGAPGRMWLPEDGAYDSKAECGEDDILMVGNTSYPCAPFVCVDATATDGASCKTACADDADCSVGTCGDGVCAE